MNYLIQKTVIDSSNKSVTKERLKDHMISPNQLKFRRATSSKKWD